MPKMIRPAVLVGAAALALAACSSPAVSPSASAEASASVTSVPTVAESGSGQLGLTGEAAAYVDHLTGRAECGDPEQDGSDLVFTCTFAEDGIDYSVEVHAGSNGTVSGTRVTLNDPSGSGFAATDFTTMASNVVGSTEPFFGSEAETAFNELFAAGSSGTVPDNLEIELPESGAKLLFGTAESDPENAIVFLVVPGPDGLIR